MLLLCSYMLLLLVIFGLGGSFLAVRYVSAHGLVGVLVILVI